MPASRIHASWASTEARRSSGSSAVRPIAAMKSHVSLGGRGRHHLEVHERTARVQRVSNLGEERPLPQILEMVDREARDDQVEPPERSDRLLHVAGAHGDPVISGEVRTRQIEHRRRAVDRDDLFDRRPSLEHHRGQPAVATAEIEHPRGRCGQEVGNHLFPGSARFELADATHVPLDLRRVGPARGGSRSIGHPLRMPPVATPTTMPRCGTCSATRCSTPLATRCTATTSPSTSSRRSSTSSRTSSRTVTAWCRRTSCSTRCGAISS